jgi:DNA-binding LacI/PurR family transcriptional regulator
MGMMAAKLLIDQMESEEPFTPITKVIDTQLIIRNSTRK